MQSESDKKGCVKVTYWNSFETGNLYRLLPLVYSSDGLLGYLKLRDRSAMSIYNLRHKNRFTAGNSDSVM